MRFLAGFLVVWAVLSGAAALDSTGRTGAVILLAVLGAAVGVERVLFGTPPRVALRRLGLTRPDVRVTAVAGLVSVALLLVFPLFTAATGAPVPLRSDWLWLLPGVFALHGLAEEVVWRGYVCRRVRQQRSFRSGVVATMPFVAVAHVPIVIASGWWVGGAALVVAAVTTPTLSALFEAGRNSVWPPALVHAAIDAFKLVEIPAETVVFSLFVAAAALVVPPAALTVRRRPARAVTG